MRVSAVRRLGWDGMGVNGSGKKGEEGGWVRKYALLNNNQMTNNPIILPSA